MQSVTCALTGIKSCPEDFFCVVREDNVVKYVSLGAGFGFLLTLSPLMASIMWYERFGSDKKRSFINRLTSAVGFCAFEWAMIVHIPYLIRFMYGPFSTSTCFIMLVARKSVTTHIVVFLNISLIVKYIMKCHLKNPDRFDDNFWNAYSKIWVFASAFIGEFVIAYLPGPKPLEYYFCQGVDPTDYFNNTERAFPYLRFASLLLHIVLYGRIKCRKQVNVLAPLSKMSFRRQLTLADIEKYSLSTGLTNSILLILSVVSSLMIVFWSKTIKHACDSISSKNYPFIYFYYLHITCLLGFAFVAAKYVNSKSLREFYMEKIKSLF